MASSTRDPIAALRQAGLRVTASRLAVLSALAAGAPHASADAIVGAVRERLGDSSAQTVYNVLRTLTEVGLVRRIEPAGHPGLFELRVGDNHHHIVCRSCGAVADVACAVGEAPCLTAAETSRYEIDEAEVIFWGRCPACLARAIDIARASDASDVPSPQPSVGHHRQGSTATWPPAHPPSETLHHQATEKGKDERV